MDDDELLEFDLPSKDPLFLTCKAFLESVKSFKPSEININFQSSYNINRSMFRIDEQYRAIIEKYPWVELPKIDRIYWKQDSIEVFHDFEKKMKRLCGQDPFSRVELLLVSKHFGRNYSSSYISNQNLCKLQKIMPNMKYFHSNFNNARACSFGYGNTVMISIYKPNQCFGLSRLNNLIYTSDYNESNKITMKSFIDSIPKKFHRNMEILLFSSIIRGFVNDARKIIENIHLDIDYFSHLWNSEIRTISSISLTIEILTCIYEKYPNFKIFKFPISSIADMEMVENLPFIHIDVARNITREFIENSLDKYFITPFCTKHNINLSRLGKYQFSALVFKRETVTSLDPNVGDCFNITPSMLLIKNNMNWKHNIDTRDKYGNNILHYYNFTTHGWMLTFHTQYSKISSLAQYSEEELLKLLDEENVFGCTAKEVAFSKYSHKIFPNIEKKVFNYSNFSRTCGNSCFRETSYLDGLLVDMRILYATRNEIKNYNYDEYKDIEYRDENGKHLVHYFNNCLSDSIRQGLRIPLKHIVYCKDANQTMPIQICYWNYYLIIEELARFSLLNTNFVSYSDNFGMYRIMYLLLRHGNLNIIFTELKIIGFDYSQNIPQLVSLFSESKDCLFYFSIERSELKQLKNVSYFGSCDGDDFSHWIIRYCLHIIESGDNFYHLDSLLYSLFKKGLRLDIVRNSLGKTAFDILQEFKPSPQYCNRVDLIKNICKRKGVQNKSKALSKFILKYDIHQKSFIQKETETEIIATACASVQLIRSLYWLPNSSTTTNK